MRRFTLFLTLALALASPTLALADFPPGQSVDPADDPKARQRLKVLRRLYPNATSYPQDSCFFSLRSRCELFPDCVPPYKAKHLLLVCTAPCTEPDAAPGCVRSVSLGWEDGAQP